MKVDVWRRSSRCVDISASDICSRWYEVRITKNSCRCPLGRQTPRVTDENVHLLVDRRLSSPYRRQHALQRSLILHSPTGIVFVCPPSLVVGACITSESISSRCRPITVDRRLRISSVVVVTIVSPPGQRTYIIIIIIIIDNRGFNTRWCLTSLLLSLPTAAYLGQRGLTPAGLPHTTAQCYLTILGEAVLFCLNHPSFRSPGSLSFCCRPFCRYDQRSATFSVSLSAVGFLPIEYVCTILH